MTRIVVLISGNGSNLAALLAAEDAAARRTVAVLSNRDAAGLAHARRCNLPTHVVKPRRGESREDYDTRIDAALAPYDPQLIVLAGFMRILSAGFVARHAGRLVNIHPSLLPKYRGLNVHQRVLDAGDAESGASVHFVTSELDAGPVLIQASVPVLADDDEAALSARIHKAEHRIYPAAVELIAAGRAHAESGSIWLDDSPLTAPLQARFDQHGVLIAWPQQLTD